MALQLSLSRDSELDIKSQNESLRRTQPGPVVYLVMEIQDIEDISFGNESSEGALEFSVDIPSEKTCHVTENYYEKTRWIRLSVTGKLSIPSQPAHASKKRPHREVESDISDQEGNSSLSKMCLSKSL